MADPLTETLARLCVTAAMLMEDNSPKAIRSLRSDPEERARRLAELRRVGADIAALLAAAEVLNRHTDLSS